MTMRWARKLLVAMLLSGAAGCATTNGDPRDPLEGFNRAMFSFNDGFDEAIGKPVATAYRDVLPAQVRTWVRNFFANIADLWIGANNLVQGKPLDAVTDWARFGFNTTLGLFGINDVASEMGIEKHDEDFGQTFGRWGAGDGPYVVWPFLGSSSVRDSAGLVLDIHFDPVVNHDPKGVRYSMVVLRAIGRRADLLDASRILEEAALDKYVFQRDAYLQRRRSLVHDGNPPRAARELPRAEAPETAPLPRAIDTAVRLLEEPAPGAVSSGG
ncbi:MAG: VacJ family lipoprotein [Betaproteobacteria bacterium]|nr:VacJ family lipoprotein [Betaproteobacteria bacterium]